MGAVFFGGDFSRERRGWGGGDSGRFRFFDERSKGNRGRGFTFTCMFTYTLARRGAGQRAAGFLMV